MASSNLANLVFEVDNLDDSSDDDDYEYEFSDSSDGSSSSGIHSHSCPSPSRSQANSLNASQPEADVDAGAGVEDEITPAPLVQSTGINIDADADADAEVDEDFDYLRESAFERDDPLEYREDLTIPIKEVIQLLGHTDASSTLRPQTRASAFASVQHRKKHVLAKPTSTSLQTNTQLEDRANNLNFNIPPPIASPVQAPIQSAPAPTLTLAPLPTATPPAVAYIPLTQDKVIELQRQLSAHLQIATHIHLNLAQKGLQKEGEHLECKQRIEAMLNRIIDQGLSSDRFHKMTQNRMEKMRTLSQQVMLNGSTMSQATSNPPSNETDLDFAHRNPAIPIRLIHATSDYLTTVSRSSWDGSAQVLTNGALKEFANEALATSLSVKISNRAQTGARAGGPEWRREDDVLLAMTIAKYGRDFGNLSADLLPHRSVDDCQRRARYLSSRRCGDNAVKRQIMILNSPLTREELTKVEEGLKRFGDPSNTETWKRIQREMLPGREWSHLQKLWNWRVHRRQYKANYRAKKQNKEKNKKT